MGMVEGNGIEPFAARIPVSSDGINRPPVSSGSRFWNRVDGGGLGPVPSPTRSTNWPDTVLILLSKYYFAKYYFGGWLGYGESADNCDGLSLRAVQPRMDCARRRVRR